jgi:hypothetical protein
LTGVADQNDLLLAFSRIVAMLSLRPGIAGSTAAEVRAGLFEMFPSLPQAIAAGKTESYRRFAVEASVSDDRSASWGHFEDKPGLTLPGTEDHSDPVAVKVPVEIFLQNVLRADLLERIEKLRAPGAQ